MSYLPDFPKCVDLLEEAQSLIKQSRQDRERRIELYEKISATYLPELIKLQKALDEVPELFVPNGELRRGLQLVGAVALLGSLASIVSLAFAIYVWSTTPDAVEIRRIVSEETKQAASK